MKNRKRRFHSGILNHCYQNTVNGQLLFYSISDYLVFFTILCICASRYGVIIISVCQMPDHVHIACTASSLDELSCFMRDVFALFAKSDSKVCNRQGQLFNKSFGSAPKQGAKKARTTIAYIGNNPVERQLCSKAIQYRWNYLAYAQSDCPFSEKIVIRKASWEMKQAVNAVKAQHNRRMPLSYAFLQRLFKTLGQKEGLQLVDFIVSTYSVIDYDYSGKLFNGIGNMIKAMEYNTGSEYDLNEKNVGRSDAPYARITKWLMGNLKLTDVHDVFALPESRRADLLLEIHSELGIEIWQLAKYLRLEIIREY